VCLREKELAGGWSGGELHVRKKKLEESKSGARRVSRWKNVQCRRKAKDANDKKDT